MPAYRVYFLSPDDHIVQVRTVEADDDKLVMAKAAEFGQLAVEVWEKARLVGRLDRSPG